MGNAYTIYSHRRHFPFPKPCVLCLRIGGFGCDGEEDGDETKHEHGGIPSHERRQWRLQLCSKFFSTGFIFSSIIIQVNHSITPFITLYIVSNFNIVEERIRRCTACTGGKHFINEDDAMQNILHRRSGLFLWTQCSVACRPYNKNPGSQISGSGQYSSSADPSIL